VSSNAIIFSREEVETAISSSKTMGAAAKLLGVSFPTFKREAERFGLYAPVKQLNVRFDLSDVFAGKHPQYPTSKLARRLVQEGHKRYMCEGCGVGDTWNGSKLTLELDHVDGDNSNHSLENLRFLCPNCHSQTPTFRNRRGKKHRNRKNRLHRRPDGVQWHI
jgi:HNH endonuclease